MYAGINTYMHKYTWQHHSVNITSTLYSLPDVKIRHTLQAASSGKKYIYAGTNTCIHKYAYFAGCKERKKIHVCRYKHIHAQIYMAASFSAYHLHTLQFAICENSRSSSLGRVHSGSSSSSACIHVYTYVCMYVCMHACMYVCICECVCIHARAVGDESIQGLVPALYVCMCVCFCVCVYACMYLCLYMCSSSRGRVHSSSQSSSVCMYIYIYICIMHVFTCTSTQASVYLYIYARINTHTYAYTHTHTHTHSDTHITERAYVFQAPKEGANVHQTI
jgi:hypothetical protein